MPKGLLLTISLAVILITGFLVYAADNSLRPFDKNTYKPGRRSEFDTAVNQAKYLYQQKKEKTEDLSNGPCLSNALMPGWVLDIAHNPRLPVDDLAENQCSALREGKASHFVELDIDGNLIRAR